MPSKTPLTRRQALLLSGSAAAGLAVAGLPRWAHSAPLECTCPADPQIDRGAQFRARHALACRRACIGSDRAPQCRRGEFHQATLGRSCASAAAIRSPSGSRTISMRRRPYIGTGLLVPSHVDGGPHNTIRAGRCLVTGDHDQAVRRRRRGSTPTRTATRRGKSISDSPA